MSYYNGDLHAMVYDSVHQEKLEYRLNDRISKMQATDKRLEISAAIHSNYYDIFCRYLPMFNAKAPNIIIHLYCIETDSYFARLRPETLIELLHDKPLGKWLYLEAKYRHKFNDGSDIHIIEEPLKTPIHLVGALAIIDAILKEVEKL